MTAPFRLGVLIVPTPADAEWRVALARATIKQDAVFAKESGDAATAPKGQSIVALISDFSEAQAFDATHWAVLLSDLETALSAASQKNPGYPRKAYKLVAERLAPLSWLREKGAIMLDASSLTLDFPALGLVSREPAPPTEPLDIPIGPAALYEENPPRVGTKVNLPLEVFTFPPPIRTHAEPPKVDLTGRGRVVVFGPRHDLPAGRWKVSARFTVETEDTDIYLKFQWGVGEDLETVEVMLQQSGEYEVALDKAWSQPGSAELRVWASNAHFMGKMEFLGAEVERLPDLTEAVSLEQSAAS